MENIINSTEQFCYNIMTLNGKYIVDDSKDLKIVQRNNGNYYIEYKYDLTEMAFRKNQLISSVDSYGENALFYQMKRMLCKKNQTWNADLLKNQIIYVDFSEVFKKYKKAIDNNTTGDYTFGKDDLGEKSEATGDYYIKKDLDVNIKLKHIFEQVNGISIVYKNETSEEKNVVTYIPFDKSGSMSRESKITFVNKEIKAELDKRLLLDLDFKSITIIPSKFYAYRGLYLSDAMRIESNKKFVLDSESVIVINDNSHDVTFKNSIPVFGEIDKKDNKWILGKKIINSYAIKPFDGEGLICPQYAHLINEQLGKYGFVDPSKGFSADFKNEASSFQIRMPFSKGVLHTVDYNSFISEYISTDESIWIKDVFGIERDIRKAKIILTDSMFKCKDWLKNIQNNTNGNAFAIPKSPDNSDPMKYFFAKMIEYNHALYVGNTNIVLSKDEYTKLNYQFLSTLGIKGEDFHKLVNAHLKRRNNIADKLLYDWEENGGDMSGEKNINENKENKINSPWLKALSDNKDFINDPKIQSLISGTRESLLLDCARGRLSVHGECRFLSRDLLSLLVFISENLYGKNIKSEKTIETLFADRFYMAQPTIELDYSKYYAFFRSPHLSRNEQCVLRPFIATKGDVYDKYFSHLSGVVMISRNSLVPEILSGADFDGDLVKIVAEPIIVNAIKNHTYLNTENNKIQKQQLERKLPVIIIPNTKSDAEAVSECISYKTIKNTFSNSIGQISNAAIKIGKKEYFENNTNFENKCAECTVITGLEIDAAKTGVHPKENIKEIFQLIEGKEEQSSSDDKDEVFSTNDNSKKKKKTENDYFLNFLNQISLLPKYNVSVKIPSKPGADIIIKSSTNKPIKIRQFDNKDDTVSNIDRLPSYFAFEKEADIREKRLHNENVIKKDYAIWDFQLNTDWKKTIDKDKKEKVKQLINAYLKILGRASELNYFKQRFKDASFNGHVNTILKLQYDDYSVKLEEGISVQEAIDATYAFVGSKLDDADKKEKALYRFIESDWVFTQGKDAVITKQLRQEKLCKIINCKEDDLKAYPGVGTLLTNFNNGGFYLLYYVLKDLILEDLQNITPDILEQYQNNKENASIEILAGNIYYNDLNEIFKKSANNLEGKKIWEPKIIEKCREKLNEIFNSDDCEALKYVYYLRSTDKNATFFWNVISSETIDKCRIISENRG